MPLQPTTARGKSYPTNVLLTTLGISRGTLRYYEQLGIVRPRRDPASNYRVYSNVDVFRVAECAMLKSAGYQVQQVADIATQVGGDAPAFMGRCLERGDRQLAWAQAVREQLASLREVVEEDFDAPPRLVMADEWLVYYDGCEGGYDQFEANEAQDSLLEGMPVSMFAAVMDIDVMAVAEGEGEAHVETRWGRSVPRRYRDLMPELADYPGEPATFGGCPCVTLPYRADEERIPGFDEDGSVCARLASYLRGHGLRQAGACIAPRVMPVRGKVYSRLYVPVEAAALRGRVALAVVRAAHALRRRRARAGRHGNG